MLKYYFIFSPVFILSIHLFALDELFSDFFICDDTEPQELIENFDGPFNPWNLDPVHPAVKGDNTNPSSQYPINAPVFPPKLPGLPAEETKQAPKVKRKNEEQQEAKDASPKKKPKVDPEPKVLPVGKSPVMLGFLYSVQLKKGGKFSDRKNGVIAVKNYRKLLEHTEEVTNKKNPTSNMDYRTKTLDRWFVEFPIKTDRGAPFTLTIKNSYKRKYKKLLAKLPPLDDNKYSSGNSSEDIGSGDDN